MPKVGVSSHHNARHAVRAWRRRGPDVQPETAGRSIKRACELRHKVEVTFDPVVEHQGVLTRLSRSWRRNSGVLTSFGRVALPLFGIFTSSPIVTDGSRSTFRLGGARFRRSRRSVSSPSSSGQKSSIYRRQPVNQPNRIAIIATLDPWLNRQQARPTEHRRTGCSSGPRPNREWDRAVSLNLRGWNYVLVPLTHQPRSNCSECAASVDKEIDVSC